MKHKPNIFIIITDQLTWRALPAYGNTYAKTPNIDRIAQRATKFTECYTPCPLCQPARAAFWTGQFPHTTGVLSNGRKHHVPSVPDDMPTLGDLFQQANYTTVHFGKRHDAGSLRGFKLVPEGTLPVEGEKAWPLNQDTFHDRYTTVKTIEFLEQYQDAQPFLAVADLVNPHNICGWVGENQGIHEDITIPGDLPPLPDNFEDTDLDKRPLPVQYICCSHNRLSQAAPWNETNYRHYLAAYYHYLQRVDAEIGLILDALAARADSEDTLIVFMADHGDGVAAHRMVTKQVSMYEETTHVPLMFAGPDIQENGCVEHALVSLLDLLPTLCDYADIPTPDNLWGRSLLPWLQGSSSGSPHPYVVSEWHTEWGFTISPGRMLRTGRYKYGRYLEGNGEELYDIQNDRGERHTLIDDPAHAAALEEHRHLLDTHLVTTSDPFFTLTWEASARWRCHPVGYPHHVGPAAPMVE